MNAANLINQSSGDVEIYTPANIVSAARRTMGDIDLDPASCELANRRIGATEFFTKEDNGLAKTWAGKIWLNHPFSRAENAAWVNKAVSEYASLRAEQICMITFASTSEAWFRPLLRLPQCFLSPRTNYLHPDGTVYRGVTKGSVVTYFGHRIAEFHAAFSPLGEVKIAYQP